VRKVRHVVAERLLFFLRLGGASPGTSASDVESRFGVKLRVSGDGKDCVRVWYDPKTDQFGTDGVVVEKASAWGGITRHGSRDEPVVLRIFLDRSVLEVYCGGAALTNRTFADAKALGVDLFAEGGTARLQSLDVWKVNPLWKP